MPGKLEHFIFVADRIAARTHFVAVVAVLGELRAAGAASGEVVGGGAREIERNRSQSVAEIGRNEVAGAVVRGVGVGDILGENALALLMPLHSGAQHRQDRNIGDRHSPLPHY